MPTIGERLINAYYKNKNLNVFDFNRNNDKKQAYLKFGAK